MALFVFQVFRYIVGWTTEISWLVFFEYQAKLRTVVLCSVSLIIYDGIYFEMHDSANAE